MTTSVAPTSSNTVLNSFLSQQNATIAAANAASSAASTSGIGGNLNTFLNILTTQLQNQDPTSATDTNQFTQELVEFAGVEQQLNTNTDLGTLINLQKSSSGAAASLGYIGAYVEAPTTDTLPLQNGSAELAYTLPAAGGSVSVAVQDSTGATVATLAGTTNSGTNYISWNGQNSSGTQLPDGTYNFVLTSANISGVAQTPTNINAFGLVTSVTTNSDGTSQLGMGSGMSVPTSSVNAVYESGALPTATAAPIS